MDRKQLVEELVENIYESIDEIDEKELQDQMSTNINEYAEENDIDLSAMGIETETQYKKLVNEVINKSKEKLKQTLDEEEKKINEIKQEMGKHSWSFFCKAGVLKKLFKTISVISEEALFNVTKEGLHTRLVDPAHVYMLDLNISRKNFYIGRDCINKKFDWNVSDNFDVCFSVNDFNDFLRLINSYEDVNGTYKDGTLHLKAGRFDQDIDAIINNQPEVVIPKLELKTSFELEHLSDFKKAIDGKDYVKLIVNKLGVSAVIYNPISEKPLMFSISNTAEGDCKSMYSCDILKMVLDSIGAALGDMEIHLDTDNPMQITGKFLEGGETKILIAPRIEEG